MWHKLCKLVWAWLFHMLCVYLPACQFSNISSWISILSTFHIQMEPMTMVMFFLGLFWEMYFSHILQKVSVLKKMVSVAFLISGVLRLFREEDFSLVICSECSLNFLEQVFPMKKRTGVNFFLSVSYISCNTNCSLTLSILLLVNSLSI